MHNKKYVKRMAKRIICVSLTVAMIVTGLPANIFSNTVIMASAQEYVVGNSTYTYEEKTDGTLTITRYEGSDAEVIIPGEIDGKQVTSIGQYAFESNKNITSVSIPVGVTSIRFGAFMDCIKLEKIVIPDGVTTVEGYGFSGCTSLKTIDWPASATTIPQNMFTDCTSLIQVNIPEGITKLGSEVFQNCASLEEIVLPNSIEEISYRAFSKTALKSIDIPENVDVILEEAFAYCEEMVSINVSESNESFKVVEGVLLNKEGTNLLCCPGGKGGEYTVPDNVMSIRGNAFRGCKNITSVIVSESVESIGIYAFFDCVGMKSISLPSNLYSIAEGAFWNCASLESITMPANMNVIGNYVFNNCVSLDDIYVAKENSMYTSIDGVLFTKDGTKLLEYPKGRDGAYAVPDGTKIIVDGSFKYCEGITEVVIPESVELIENYAFAACGLEKVTLTSEETQVATRAFGWNGRNAEGELEIRLNADFVYVGNQGGIAENLAKNNFAKFESVDGTYKADYSEGMLCYEAAMPNYEAVIEHLNEYYIEKYPEMALENTYGTDEERAFFKGVANEIIEGASDVPAWEALYNWMNENIKSPINCNMQLAYPMDVYNFRMADCCGNALLLCELLRSADIPAIVMYGYVADMTMFTEKDLFEGRLVEHAWVLAYCDKQWISLDSAMNIVADNKDDICKWYYITGIDEKTAILNDMYNLNLVGGNGIYYDGDKYGIYDAGTTLGVNLNSAEILVSPENLIFGYKYLNDIVDANTGEAVEPVMGNSGLVYDGNGVYHYLRANTMLARHVFKYIDERSIYFNEHGDAFDITALEGNYRKYKGNPVVKKGTQIDIMPMITEDIIDVEITWKSYNEEVVTVDEQGNLVAVGNGEALVIGESIIYTSEYHWYGQSYSISLFVDDFATEISLTDELTLDVGDTEVLEPTLNESSEIFTNLIWETSDENVATVDDEGNVSAVNPGVAIITVIYGDGSGLSASCEVIVTSDTVDVKEDVSGEGLYIEYPKTTITELFDLNASLITEEDEEYETIRLDVKGQFKAFDINITNDDGEKIQPEGKVTIRIPCPLGFEGKYCRVYYVNEDGLYFDMKATYSGGFIIFETTHFSTYLITEEEVEGAVNYIYGDANSDGDVNSQDAVVVNKLLAGYSDTGANIYACDVDCDGDITSSDAVLLLKYLAGYDVVLGN